MQKRSVLFVSYDGLTDPLGQSQILPYLLGLNRLGHRITILSCEKEKAFRERREDIEKMLAESSIEWHHLPYRNRPPLLGSFLLINSLQKKADEIVKKNNIEIVHCRSLIPAMIGASLQRKYQLKFIFDIRGFWADERVEGGLWNMSNPIFSRLYQFFKKKETKYFEQADQVISLTHAAKAYIEKNYSIKREIAVIPCSADLAHFGNVDKANSVEIRKELGIESDAYVLSYLGSLGTRYLLREMMLFFKFLKAHKSNAVFLFISKHSPDLIYKEANSVGLDPTCIKVKSSAHQEVQDHLALSNANIFFIKSSFTGLAVSPTKMGEALACGLPVIANTGVGDTAELIQNEKLGIVVDGFDEKQLEEKSKSLLDLTLNSNDLKSAAEKHFSLDKAIDTYHTVYTSL